MNNIKYLIFSVTIILGIMLLTSCKKEEAKSLAVTPTSKMVTAEGGSFNITITSNTDWAIKSEQTWCTFSSYSGINNAIIKASYHQNAGTAQKTLTMTIVGIDVNPVTVSITQEGREAANNPKFAAVQTNPFGLSELSIHSAPAFADIDDDGDFDMIAGNQSGNLVYVENIGTESLPNFTNIELNPFGLNGLSIHSIPSIVDIDNDGDYDVMVGNQPGNFMYYENVGTKKSPNYAPVQTNPFGLEGHSVHSAPAFVDIDNDGDYDLIAGGQPGSLLYFENIGTQSSPIFATVQTNPFGLTELSHHSVPTFVDIDGDGDYDLIAGDQPGDFKFFKNIGTESSPNFAPVQTNPYGLTGLSHHSVPFFVDIDNDGDFDIIAGDQSGNISYFKDENFK